MTMTRIRHSDAVLLSLIVAVAILGSGSAIRIKNFVVPPQVKTGDTVILHCEADPEEGSLYSLTWWKDDLSFYQYIPSQNKNKNKNHKIAGINVDESRSTKGRVVVTNVSLAASGLYKCELLAANSWEHEFNRKNLTVVDIPDRTPILLTAKTHLSPGDVLVANCTSPGSKPPATLEWKIHNSTVIRNYSQIILENVDPYTGLYTRTSQLRLPVRETYFKNGNIVVECSAYIKDIYHELSHVAVTRNGYRTVAPSQKYFGKASALTAMLVLPMVALWTHITICLIWSP